MWQINSLSGEKDFFQSLEKELVSLIDGEPNFIANLANICSYINHVYPNLNWCGFYLWDDKSNDLVLGPFQGKPACVRIKPGRGVCGTSYTKSSPVRVDDVNTFPDHIACDSASLSELVIPLIKNGKVLGVLDLDSPRLKRFTAEDEEELFRIMTLLTSKIF